MNRPQHTLTAPLGFWAAGGAFGIKPSGKPDMALIAADTPCAAAAVFTTTSIPSEPVQVGRRHLRRSRGRMRAIVCNAGNANASTGRRGVEDAEAMCAAVAERIGCRPTQVLACSTGVIGEPMPMDRVHAGIDGLSGRLRRAAAADRAASEAILTTDLTTKAARRRVKVGGHTVTLAGIAKGSGMIAPNMATMLAFLTTDAAISVPLLRRALRDAVNADASFNRISVDTDTSPSDTAAVLASGRAGNRRIDRRDSAAYRRFADTLCDLCRDLAYRIVADGEGATKVIRAIVEGARSEPDAHRIARAVVDSPLVKTAVHGADPNWGRLTMAIGKSGAHIRPTKLTVRIGNTTVYRNGGPARFSAAALHRYMQQREVAFTIRPNAGAARCEWLGCDLGKGYVTINAEYHT